MYNNGGWQCVFDTHSSTLAREYAQNRVNFSSSMERVEVRDDFGRAVLETVFDRSQKQKLPDPGEQPRSGSARR
jgi:hypothetical protein